jgi:hypothetical protein
MLAQQSRTLVRLQQKVFERAQEMKRKEEEEQAHEVAHSARATEKLRRKRLRGKRNLTQRRRNGGAQGDANQSNNGDGEADDGQEQKQVDAEADGEEGQEQPDVTEVDQVCKTEEEVSSLKVSSSQAVHKKTVFGDLSKVPTFGHLSQPSTPQKPLTSFHKLFASTPATKDAPSTPVFVLQQPLSTSDAPGTPLFKFEKAQHDTGLRAPRYRGSNAPYGKNMRDVKPKSASIDHVSEYAPLPSQEEKSAVLGFSDFKVPSGFNWSSALGATPSMCTPSPVFRDHSKESVSFEAPPDAFSFNAGPGSINFSFVTAERSSKPLVFGTGLIFGRPQQQPPPVPSVGAQEEPYVGKGLILEEAKVSVLHQAVNTSNQTEGTEDLAEAGLREPMDDIDLAEKNEETANDEPGIDSSSDDDSIDEYNDEELEQASRQTMYQLETGRNVDGVTPEELEAHEAKPLKEFSLDRPMPEREISGLINHDLEHYQDHVVGEQLSGTAEEKLPVAVSIFQQSDATSDTTHVNIFGFLKQSASKLPDSDDEASEASDDDDDAQSEAAHDLDAIEPLTDDDLHEMADDEVEAGSVDASLSESAASVDSSVLATEDIVAIDEETTTVTQSSEDDEDAVVSVENEETTVQEVTDVEQPVEEEAPAPSSSDEDSSSEIDAASNGTGLTSPSLGSEADNGLKIDYETAEGYLLEGYRRYFEKAPSQDEDSTSNAVDVSEKDAAASTEIDAPVQEQWLPEVVSFDFAEFEFISRLTNADFNVPAKLELNIKIFNDSDWALDTLAEVLAPAESGPELPELELDMTPLSDTFEASLFVSFEKSCDDIVVPEKTLKDKHTDHESRMLGLTQLLKQAKLEILAIDDEPETEQVAQQIGFSVITAVVTEPASEQDGPEPQQTGKPATGHTTKKVRFHLAASDDHDGRPQGLQHPNQYPTRPYPGHTTKKLNTRSSSTSGRDYRPQEPEHGRRPSARSIPHWLDEVHTNLGTDERGEPSPFEASER